MAKNIYHLALIVKFLAARVCVVLTKKERGIYSTLFFHLPKDKFSYLVVFQWLLPVLHHAVCGVLRT